MLRSDQTSRMRSYGRMNYRMTYLLGVLIGLIPIPVASNRPILWLAFGLIIMLMAVWWLVKGHMLAPGRGLQIAQHKMLLIGALAVPLFAVLQALPVATWLPAMFSDLPPNAADLPRMQTLSVLPYASLIGALRAMIFLTFLGLVIEVSSRPAQATRLGWIIFGAIFCHAIWGLVALKLLGDVGLLYTKTDYLGSATGAFVNRNSFATFLGFGVILGSGLILGRVPERQRHSRAGSRPVAQIIEDLLLWGSVGIIGLTLVATQSRLGVCATLIGASVTVAICRIKAGASALRAISVVAAGLAATAIASFLILGSDLIERMLFINSDAANRMDIYAQAFDLAMRRPFTGWGYDGFQQAFDLVRQPPLLMEQEIDLAHNSYLTLWVELGFLIGSMPGILLAVAGWSMWRNLRQPTNFVLPAAGLGALTLGAVHSLGDFSLEIPANVFVFLAICGLGIASAAVESHAQNAHRKKGRCS